MELYVTGGVMAALILFAIFAGWRGAQPMDVAKGPRMIPWPILMMLALAGAVLAGAHLLGLFGLNVGGQR